MLTFSCIFYDIKGSLLNYMYNGKKNKHINRKLFQARSVSFLFLLLQNKNKYNKLSKENYIC